MTTTDDDLEQRLRDSLHAVGASVRPPDRLVEQLYRAAATTPKAETETLRADVTAPHQLSDPGRRARDARWAPLLAVAAVVAILVVGVGVVALHRSRTTVPAPSSYAGGPVPWSEAGARATTQLAPPTTIARAAEGTRACLSDDFRVVSGSSKRAIGPSGWMVTTYTLVSVTSSPCVLGYVLPAGLVDSRGVSLPVEAGSHGGAMPRFDLPPRVDPGELVTGTVSWGVVQGATNPPADVVILPDGYSAGSRRRPPLAISLSGVTIPPNPENPTIGGGDIWRGAALGNEVTVSQPESLASLISTVTAPDSVRLGQVLSYAVELRNLTDDPVSLANCPELIEVLSVVPQKVAISSGRRGRLNCAAAPRSISPHTAIVFQMKLPTIGVVAGSGSLTWQLVTDGAAVVNSRSYLTVLP